MDGKAFGYLITIGLAWLPWIFFNKKVLGGVSAFSSGIDIVIPILVWFYCLAMFYGRSKQGSEQSGIELLVGKISVVLLLLIFVPVFLANMVGIDL